MSARTTYKLLVLTDKQDNQMAPASEFQGQRKSTHKVCHTTNTAYMFVTACGCCARNGLC